MTQVNAVNIKKIPQLTEVLELPSNADIPIYDPATGVTGRIKAALLKGGEEIKTNWASTTTYAIDAVVEFQLKLWKSLINNNTGNTPVEGSNWTEVSKSSGNGYGYYGAGVFTQDPSMVIRSGGLFLLDNTKVTFPFNSTDFEAEYDAGIWVQPTGHEAGVITTDTTNFNKNLTSAENTVQKALDKIDDLDIPQTTTIDIDTLEPYDPLLTYNAGVYKSYVNLESSDTQFHDPAIYLSMFPVGIGQTPESHPYDPDTNTGFWWYLGSDPVEVTSRATSKTTVFSEGELRAIEGAKSGDTCNIMDAYLAIEVTFKFDINSTASEIAYTIVKPLDGNGRWLAQGVKNLQAKVMSYSLPYAAGFNYGLSPNILHYYKAVDLRPNAQLFVFSTYPTSSALFRSEEFTIFFDNSINTVDLAIIFSNVNSNIIEWVGGTAFTSLKAGKKAYLQARWMFVSEGVYKFVVQVDPVNEEVSGVDYENIFFESIAPDKAYITRGFNWKIASVTEYVGTSTILTSRGTSYTIGATVNAGDYLTVTNTTINARLVAIIQAV